MIIGIAGGTGSGKTTVVEKIVELFDENEVALLSQDSYYKDNSHLTMEQRNAINYDHPDSIDFKLLCQHLQELKEGRNIAQPTYSYVEHNRMPETRFTPAKKVTIVEGILIFTVPQLRALCDVKVFVDTPDDERLIRRVRRDLKERGRDIEEILCRYENTLRPMHLQFIEPTKRYADIIVPEGGNNSVAIKIIANTIKDRLKTV